MRALASYREAMLVAVRSVFSSKLRSFLTLLGVILATTTLIVVMSMVHGMDVYVAQQVSDMGTDGFQVQRIPLLGDFDPKKLIELDRRNPKLTLEEFQYLKSQLTLVREFGMSADKDVSVHYRGQVMDGVDMTGVTSNMAAISDLGVTSGRFITDFDDQRHTNVAFIGNDLRERFFRDTDAIGKTIMLDGKPFEVIGVSDKKGSVFGFSQDNFVMIPLGTFFKVFGAHSEASFHALALDHDHLNDAQDEVHILLRAHRKLRPNQEDNFGLLSSSSLVSLWDRITKTLATMAVGIVSVFMVVGGVVIMNIMLAVVTERTYEIGIRKAVGARNGDIMRQFLIESSLLSATGGLMGVVLAWLLTVVVRSVTPMPMAVPPSAVVVGVGVSALVGLFFGVYPAHRAAKLDPIHALRWER
ncbi:MAG: ABC transporter permease [Bryobacteraceae bacterium]|jgi:putative ABC transport system permease protein